MKTTVTMKVVSTMKHLKVSDALGVEVRKDVKKVSKLLGAANNMGSQVTNTFSTHVGGYNAEGSTEEKVLNARIDVVANIIRGLDSMNDPNLEVRISNFHKVVANEKRKLYEEYGNTAIPADRYRQYLDACRKVEVVYWVSQLVVNKVSDKEFDGAIYNSESGRYHQTVKTKTVVTMNPITSETLLAANLIIEYKDDEGETSYKLPEIHGNGLIAPFKRNSSGMVEIAEVVDQRTGQLLLVLRKRG